MKQIEILDLLSDIKDGCYEAPFATRWTISLSPSKFKELHEGLVAKHPYSDSFKFTKGREDGEEPFSAGVWNGELSADNKDLSPRIESNCHKIELNWGMYDYIITETPFEEGTSLIWTILEAHLAKRTH